MEMTDAAFFKGEKRKIEIEKLSWLVDVEEGKKGIFISFS
jgi:hypothetical protein